jgi:hypothetical protein
MAAFDNIGLSPSPHVTIWKCGGAWLLLIELLKAGHGNLPATRRSVKLN